MITKKSKRVNTRIDKFLWSVRVYKTRTMATENCKKGRVIVNDNKVKPSYTVEIENIIIVTKPPVKYTYNVKGIPPSRVAAKMVEEFIDDLTPESEKEKLVTRLIPDFGNRARGAGRPTKKERRNIDKIIDDPK